MTEAAAVNSASGFDTGSGTLGPDGKTVTFHIADGTGARDWNTMDRPVRVQRAMTLHLVDDDHSKQHLLHTLGQPCTHGTRPIGTGYDCEILMSAPTGIINGVFDHNAEGGRGRLYVEVVP